MQISSGKFNHEEVIRRSGRKSKKIDKNHFVQVYSKQKIRKNTSYNQIQLGQNVKKYCHGLMEIDPKVHEDYVLKEMNKALSSQSQKLYNLFKIKLSQGPLTLEDNKSHYKIKNSPYSQDRMKILDDEYIMQNESLIVHKLSFFQQFSQESNQPQQSSHNNENLNIYQKLFRRESAKLLCDNYENHELIYSMEELIPKIAKEDIDFRFIEEMQ